MSKKNISSTILQLIGARPILFNPIFAKKPSNITNAVFLSQMVYWQTTKGYEDKPENWFYKSVEELEEETTLSPYQQRKAVEFWSNIKVVKNEIKGMPPKRWFFVDIRGVVAFANSTCNRKIGLKSGEEKGCYRYDFIDEMYGWGKKDLIKSKETSLQ